MIRPFSFLLSLGFLLPALVHAQSLSFEERGATAGVQTASGIRGVAVHDYNQDGWDDLLLTAYPGASVLLRNNQDGTFTDVSQAAGLDVEGQYFVGLWGDLDQDGDADLFFGQRLSGTNKMYLNQGDGTFAQASVAGLDTLAKVGSASFADFDADGKLDLFLSVFEGPDLLYRNTTTTGTLAFEDISAAAGVRAKEGGVPMQAAWVDFDQDGDQDLLAMHDGKAPSRLYENTGQWPMPERAVASGITGYPGSSCCNMGIAYADLDNDGWQDLYITRMVQGSLYLNQRDGTFADAAPQAGIAHNGMSWGVVAADFGNSGYQSLMVVSSSSFDGTPALFFQNDAGTFSETGSALGIDYHIDAFGLATGDFNNDGLPDLFIPDGSNGRNKLLINTTPDAGSWAKVHLTGTTQNRLGIGARVEIVAQGQTWVRTVGGGDSFCSQSSSTLHFGLGAFDQIDTLRVVWAPGLVDEHVNLMVDTTHVLTQQNTTTHRDLASALPEPSFALSSVFPNPFRSQAQVTLELTTPTEISLVLTDVLGRTVQTIATGFYATGTHTFTAHGDGLPTGLYILHLVSLEGRSSRSLTLLR